MPGAKSKNKMIYGKSVHSVQFWFLFIKFIRLGGEGFKAECTLLCTESDHFNQSHQEPTEASMYDVKLSDAAAVNGYLSARSGRCDNDSALNSEQASFTAHSAYELILLITIVKNGVFII
jgi:hypothetical protein